MADWQGPSVKPGRRIFRNFGYLSAGKLAADASAFVFFVFLARIYGESGVGQYGVAMAVSALLAVVADFGLNRLSVAEMARAPKDAASYFGRLLPVRLALSAAVLSAMIAGSLSFSLPWQITALMLLLGAHQVFVTLIRGFGAVFIANERMHVTSLLECCVQMAAMILGVTVGTLGGGLVLAVACFPAVSMTVAIFGYLAGVRQWIGARTPLTLRETRSTLGRATPYALHGMLAEFSTRMPVLVVGAMLGVAAVGALNAATRVVVVLMFVPTFAGIAMFPVASRLHVESETQLKELYRMALNVVLLVGLPIAAGIWLIAPELITLLYGDEFGQSGVLLQWLAWLVLAIFLRAIMEIFMTASDRQGAVMRSQFLVAAVGTVLLIALILSFGLTGAPMGILSIQALLIALYARSLGYLFSPGLFLSRLAMGAAAVLAFVVPFSFLDLPIFVVVPCSAMIYLAVLVVFRDIRNVELRLVRQYVPGIRRQVPAAGEARR